ncbi:MAG: glycerophosphodiester phosphodiesterase family protein [Ferruginibacter sp.]
MNKIKGELSFLAFILLIPLPGIPQEISLPKCNHQFIVIAHRGDHTNAPENTLAAFQHAIDVGVDFIEIDLRTTKDSQLVIMHNMSVNQMTGYDGNIKDILFDSLRQIKVRDKLHSGWGVHLIPSFSEVLKLCHGKINIYLDFKDASAEAAYKEILRAGMEKNMVVYINEQHQFTEWRKIAPQMPLMMSLPKVVGTKQAMTQLLDVLKVDVLDGSYDEYNSATILAAKEKHVPVWADIQSASEGIDDWDKAMALGLAGLQTDHPQALIDYLKKKGIR